MESPGTSQASSGAGSVAACHFRRTQAPRQQTRVLSCHKGILVLQQPLMEARLSFKQEKMRRRGPSKRQSCESDGPGKTSVSSFQSPTCPDFCLFFLCFCCFRPCSSVTTLFGKLEPALPNLMWMSESLSGGATRRALFTMQSGYYGKTAVNAYKDPSSLVDKGMMRLRLASTSGGAHIGRVRRERRKAHDGPSAPGLLLEAHCRA